MESIYEFLPDLDEDGKELHIEDLTPLANGLTVLTDFRPTDVSSRSWQVPRLQKVWRPRQVADSHPTRPSDFPWIGLRVPTVSRRAVEALGAILESNGELLPLVCETGDYFAYNVTTVADVLDRDGSEVEWFEIDRLRKRELVQARNVHRYQFHGSRVQGLWIFRIPEQPGRYYVTERFVEATREHGLVGLHVRRIWNSVGGDAEVERLRAKALKKRDRRHRD